MQEEELWVERFDPKSIFLLSGDKLEVGYGSVVSEKRPSQAESVRFSVQFAEPRIKKNDVIFVVKMVNNVFKRLNKRALPIFKWNSAEACVKVLFNGISSAVARITNDVNITWVVCTAVM